MEAVTNADGIIVPSGVDFWGVVSDIDDAELLLRVADRDGRAVAADALRPLAWDSEHFGFPVGRIADAELDDAALWDLLESAREDGMAMVYWAAPADRRVPEVLLREFAGLLADRKATFAGRLRQSPVTWSQSPAPGAALREHPQGPASGAMVALGIEAGVYSRFRVDPNVPRQRFEALYATWIRRSTLHEMADAVFTAGDADDPAGLITVSESDGQGSVDLVAVRDDRRRQGIGSALIRRAHEWMLGRGLTATTVVTQLDNAAACGLYQRNGYELDKVEHFYHFWPQKVLFLAK